MVERMKLGDVGTVAMGSLGIRRSGKWSVEVFIFSSRTRTKKRDTCEAKVHWWASRKARGIIRTTGMYIANQLRGML